MQLHVRSSWTWTLSRTWERLVAKRRRQKVGSELQMQGIDQNEFGGDD